MGEIPEDSGALMQSVLNDPEAKYNSADLNVAYKMKVDEYQKLCPYAEALEENWGKPPGMFCAHPGCEDCWSAENHTDVSMSLSLSQRRLCAVLRLGVLGFQGPTLSLCLMSL